MSSLDPEIVAKLDRPIWSALATAHAHLAEGRYDTLRYRRGIAPFIGFRADGGNGVASSAELFGDGEQLVTLQRMETPLPPGLVVVNRAAAVQLVAKREIPWHSDDRIAPLDERDVDEMLELATLTRPGPFTREILRLGSFFGIRIDGRLVSMAGERWRQPGLTEVSGVCTHPDWHGQGLARTLSRHVAGLISARGDRPYLHAYASNSTAIELYRSIGFELRAEMHVTFYEKSV